MPSIQTPTVEINPRFSGLQLAVIIFTILAIVIGGLLILNYYIQTKKIADPVTPSNNQTFSDLKRDPAFQEAWSNSQAGNYSKALELYKGMQVPESDQKKYSFIQFEIAHATLNLNREEGVRAFLDLHTNPSVNTITRAYAINALAAKYASSHDLNFLLAIKNGLDSIPTASTSLASGLISANDHFDSLIALYELSSSYYPLSDSEMNLAFFYSAKAALAAQNNDGAEVKKYSALTLQKIASADADLNQVKDSENLKWSYPFILMRKAMALEKLKNAGIEVDDPEKYFEQALIVSFSQGKQVTPFIQYHYATYLNDFYGEEKKEKIITLIKPIVDNSNNSQTANFFEFVRNAYKNNEVRNTTKLSALAKIYPPFGEAIK